MPFVTLTQADTGEPVVINTVKVVIAYAAPKNRDYNTVVLWEYGAKSELEKVTEMLSDVLALLAAAESEAAHRGRKASSDSSRRRAIIMGLRSLAETIRETPDDMAGDNILHAAADLLEADGQKEVPE